MKKTIERRRIQDLRPHPNNAALYGNEHEVYDQKMVDSLRQGIWGGEIQVTIGDVIISGHRRCSHAIFADIEEADVWVRRDLPAEPDHPKVLEALLQGNLQRNKTREQQLREFELWLVVEKKLAEGRVAAAKTKNGSEQNAHPQKGGKSRDLAAERVGLGAGDKAEAALKALKAADAAEASGDAEQVEKARLVKQELTKSLGGAVRVAREQGLIDKPSSKAKPAKPKLSHVQDTQPPEPAPIVTASPVKPEHAPEATLEPPADTPRPRPISPENRKVHESQYKWIRQRWLPAAKQLMEISAVLQAENTRLGNAYRHRELGGKIFTIPYQRAAAEWAEKGYLTEIAEALNCEEATLDAVLLKLEKVGKWCSYAADGLRMFTGCRPDNNLHS